MLRDKIAMAAMQGILASRKLGPVPAEWVAGESYRQADAMMKERANWDFNDDPETVTIVHNVHNSTHVHHGIDAPGNATGVPGAEAPTAKQGYDPDKPISKDNFPPTPGTVF